MRKALVKSIILAYWCARGQFKAVAFPVFSGATCFPVFPFFPLRVVMAAADRY